MQAFRLINFGDPPILSEIDRTKPRGGEIELQIFACGLNFADLLMVSGQYQDTPKPPFTLGLEVAGVVTDIGTGVDNVSVGDRVAVFAGSGGLAEYGCFAANRCIHLPDSMPFTEAAAFQVAYGTSHLALHHRARIAAKDTVLVLGAAGGVGLTAIEIAKLSGATVIAVARGSHKLTIAKQAGADHVLDSDTNDIRAEVKALGGADIVFDPIGGTLSKAAMRACNPQARFVIIGFASGDIPQFPANILLVKNITVIGHYWGGFLNFAPQTLTASMRELMRLYSDGKLRPHISHVLPLAKAGEAMDLLRNRKSTGKVVVTPRPESLAV